MFQGHSLQYPQNIYDVIIPGSEIPEWFTHQSMGDEANIKEPSNLCNECIGFSLFVRTHITKSKTSPVDLAFGSQPMERGGFH